MAYTVVSFHAHPDDEAFLVAGTLARAAAEGHRIILVTATDGAAGLTATDGAAGLTNRDGPAGLTATDGAAGLTATDGPAGPGTVARAAGDDLAARRLEELRRSAAALGCHEIRMLGYDDSGMDGRAGRAGRSFATADPDDAAGRLAAILNETGADVLTVYDPAGGYGHPDHVQVYRVGTKAARLAGTRVVLEATVDRRPLIRILRLARRSGILRVLGVDPAEWNAGRFAHAFADPERITHRVDVRRHLPAKRSAMAAHASQTSADSGVRTLAALLGLPSWLFQRVFAHEWFVEMGRRPGPRPLDDIFASLRTTVADHSTSQAGPG